MSTYVIVADILTRPIVYKIAFHAKTEAKELKLSDLPVPEDYYILLADTFRVADKQIKNEFNSYQLAKRCIAEHLTNKEQA